MDLILTKPVVYIVLWSCEKWKIILEDKYKIEKIQESQKSLLFIL